MCFYIDSVIGLELSDLNDNVKGIEACKSHLLLIGMKIAGFFAPFEISA